MLLSRKILYFIIFEALLSTGKDNSSIEKYIHKPYYFFLKIYLTSCMQLESEKCIIRLGASVSLCFLQAGLFYCKTLSFLLPLKSASGQRKRSTHCFGPLASIQFLRIWYNQIDSLHVLYSVDQGIEYRQLLLFFNDGTACQGWV